MYQEKHFLLEATYDGGTDGPGAPPAAPVPHGTHGRMATLDETLDALLSALKRDVKIKVASNMRPVAIPGDPLTEMGEVSFGMGEKAGRSIIAADSMKKVLGSDGRTSVFHLFTRIDDETFDANDIGDEHSTFDDDYFWSNYYFLSISKKDFYCSTNDNFHSKALGKFTNSSISLPSNLVIALFKHRSAEVAKYRDLITFDDDDNFQSALKAAGITIPTPAPARNAAATHEELEARIEEATQAMLGITVEDLCNDIKAADGKTIRVISGFGRDLDRIAEDMVLAISRDQHRSDVDTAKLSADLRELADLNAANLAKSFFKPMDNAVLGTKQSAIATYQPGWFEALMIACHFTAGHKAKLQAELDALIKAEEDKQAKAVSALQTRVDDVLTTTQSFQDAALDRGDVIQGQDSQCDKVHRLLEIAIDTLGELADHLHYEDNAIERGYIDSRIEKMRGNQQAIANQRQINKGLLSIDLVHSDGIDRLGSQMVTILQRIQQGEALVKVARLADMSVDANRVELDVFDEAARIAARFREAVDAQELKRMALIRDAMEMTALPAPLEIVDSGVPAPATPPPP